MLSAVQEIDELLLKVWETHGIQKKIDTYLRNKSSAVSLFEIQAPQLEEEELIKTRYLCRGGGLLLTGPTGIGKSSLLMQFAICWAMGIACFGLTPSKPLEILLVQAENDFGDLIEQRDGIAKGLELSHNDQVTAFSRIFVKHENSTSGEDFTNYLRFLLRQRKYDLLIIDPANAYIGGDVLLQKDVGRFLRNQLNPLLSEFNIGLVLAHHTNKPLRGKEKDSWKAGDWAYSGAGSAEWANWARAILTMRSIGEHSIFQLIAAKRGGRLNWYDEKGNKIYDRYISHLGIPGVICWREASPEEIPEEIQQISLEQKIANLWNNEEEQITEEEFKSRVKKMGKSKSLPAVWWKRGLERHVFKILSNGLCVLTGKYRPVESNEILF